MNRLFPKEVQKEYDWAFAHYGALAKRYPNQWVAFANGRILAAGPRLTTVLRLASRKQKDSQIPHLFVESGIHVYFYHAHRA